MKAPTAIGTHAKPREGWARSHAQRHLLSPSPPSHLGQSIVSEAQALVEAARVQELNSHPGPAGGAFVDVQGTAAHSAESGQYALASTRTSSVQPLPQHLAEPGPLPRVRAKQEADPARATPPLPNLHRP